MIQKATGLEIIRDFHKNTPNSPGVYRMFDENGKVLYVGKAKNLHKRIKNYTDLDGLSERIKKMIHETRKMEIIQTNTENEALIVEQDLIKKLNPKYNILLKDDKSYPYLTISKDEFPKLGKFRGDKSSAFHFFGPFPSSLAVNEGIKIIQSMFGLRTCRDTLFKNRQSPCLLYQIKKCSAPCCLKIIPEQYRAQVDKAISFLKGENKAIINEFSEKMQIASQNRDYETAIIYRDKISYLNQILKKSTFSSLDSDTDIICLVNRDNVYEIEVFFSRKSIICGNFSYFPTKTQNATEEEILYEFIEQFYLERDIPKLILTNIPLTNIKEELEETLSGIKGAKVEIDTPQKGEKKKIVDNIVSNANAHLEHKFITEINQKKYMDDMQKLFHLPNSPKRIDVFDNSHTFGTNKIGAMIVVG
ncbi:MAG: excinuclease ABC subunit UvrC, partial [Alphaproteobacteria bacterium]|nr:excinuclease ABC subunit UvrC [Alphaproteobacteria bacterium]